MDLEEAIQSKNFTNEQHRAILNVLYTAWWFKTLVSQQLKDFDMTHEQYNVLRILKGSHPNEMCVKEIAARMIEKNSNVPRIIDRLEAKAWVLRNTSQWDKRETVMSITQNGMDILKLASERVELKAMQNIGLNSNDALKLNEILDRIRKD